MLAVADEVVALQKTHTVAHAAAVVEQLLSCCAEDKIAAAESFAQVWWSLKRSQLDSG